MKRSLLFVSLLLLLVSCRETIEYKGKAVEPQLWVSGDLTDTTGSLLFVGRTSFFQNKIDVNCDPGAEVLVSVNGGPESRLAYNGNKGYIFDIRPQGGDTLTWRIHSRDFPEGRATTVCPYPIDFELVSLGEPANIHDGEPGRNYCYITFDISCDDYRKNNGNILNFNFGAFVERTYVQTYYDYQSNTYLTDTITDTVPDTWTWRPDCDFFAPLPYDNSLDFFDIVEGGDGLDDPYVWNQQNYTVNMSAPRQRIRLVYYDYDKSSYLSYRILYVYVNTRISPPDRLRYERSRELVWNSVDNPFAEPAQLWSNVVSDSKGAGIITVSCAHMKYLIFK